ncbi:ATP-binding protein [bacterium]|nr:MAG: ATP-binding protein [bacterium]
MNDMDFPIRKGQDGNYYLLDFEDTEREFKQNVKAVCPEDLVAMANGSGGSILIGVEEVRLDDGSKAGRVMGCPLTDELKLNINNKASSCLPAIAVDFEEHWAGGIPFVEIIIPEGADKPYCSASGCYRIRLDGSNRALDPPALVTLILERESKRFLKRFRNATAELEKMIEKIADKIEQFKFQENDHGEQD